MKRFLLILLFLNLLGALSAQQVYFNRRYHFGGINGATSIVEDNTGYNLIGFSDAVDTLREIMLFTKLDSFGNVILSNSYGKDYFNYYTGGYGSLFKLKDGSFIAAASIEDSTGNSDALIYKFNSNGDTLWTKEYGDTSFQSGWMAKQTRDGGYILTGQTATYNYYGDVWLLKTDSLGNMQWQKHYRGGGYNSVGVSIDTCFDGGYLIAGYTENLGIYVGKWYIIKTDSLGNVKWTYSPSGTYTNVAWSCLQAKDGNYIIAGDTTYNDPLPHGGDEYSKPYILKLDTAGKTIWAKGYGPIIESVGLFSIKELDDGSLIAVGNLNDSSADFSNRGLIIKTSSQGDSSWYRIYANITGKESDNILYNVNTTMGEGFIATGYVAPLPPDTGRQDTWVLKIDSNGCEEVNCVITGVKEIVSSEGKALLKNYPNPFNSSTTIEATVSQNVKKAFVSIHDYLGKERMVVALTNGFNTFNVSSNQLGGGMYFYSLIEDGKTIATNKMVVIE